MTTLTPEETKLLLAIADQVRERERQAKIEEYKKRFEEWLALHPIKERG